MIQPELIAYCASVAHRELSDRIRMHSWIVTCAIALGALTCFGDDWKVGRGNSASTAVASGKMTDRPEVLWQYKTDSEKSGFEGTPVVADGKVFLGDFEGTMHAIDLKTGDAVWTSKKKDGFITAAAYHKGKVVIGDFSGIVYCFDGATGEQIWTREMDQQVASGANFYGDDVLITSESGSMIALDLATGEPKWNYATGDQLRSSASIWTSFALLGGCDGRLHKIDITKAKAVGDGIALDAPTMSTPSVIGNVAIVGTQPGVVMAIDIETEKVLWSFSDQAMANDIRSSPATLASLEDGVLSGITVVTTRNRRALGLDIKNGSVLWEAILRKRSDGSPVICDGRAWIGAVDGSIYAIDLKEGKEKWTCQVSGQILASPAISDGKLIIATEKGSVYCFGEK